MAEFQGRITVRVDARFTIEVESWEEARNWARFYAGMGLASVTSGV